MRITSNDIIYFVVISLTLLIANIFLFAELDDYLLSQQFKQGEVFQDFSDRWEYIGNGSEKFQFYSAYFDERRDVLGEMLITHQHHKI